MSRLAIRLGWMFVCVVVWPIYYARLFVEYLFRPIFKAKDEGWLDYGFRLATEARQPPFLNRLRG